jgi:hypothetical protein
MQKCLITTHVWEMVIQNAHKKDVLDTCPHVVMKWPEREILQNVSGIGNGFGAQKVNVMKPDRKALQIRSAAIRVNVVMRLATIVEKIRSRFHFLNELQE